MNRNFKMENIADQLKGVITVLGSGAAQVRGSITRAGNGPSEPGAPPKLTLADRAARKGQQSHCAMDCFCCVFCCPCFIVNKLCPCCCPCFAICYPPPEAFPEDYANGGVPSNSTTGKEYAAPAQQTIG